MNILLGDISSYKAISVAKFIRENYSDFKIYSFDSRSFTNDFHTKYVDKNFVIEDLGFDSFIDIIDTYKIDFFIPVINESLARFWKNKNKFKNTLNYLGEFSTYQILNDKLQLHELAKDLKILVPEKYKSLKQAIIPFVVKPNDLSSAKGVIYINQAKDIPISINTNTSIIQQYVKGTGVGYSFYCKNGRIMDGYGHKRLAEYPVSGGSSTYREHYQDERMNEMASKIVKHLNFSGFAMFEFLLTDSNKLYLLEVNPRIWGSINQGMVNGTNYFKEIFGTQKTKIKKKKNHVKTYIGPVIYISLVNYLFKMNFKPVFIFFNNVFNNVPDVNFIYDPKGYLSTIIRKLTS